MGKLIAGAALVLCCAIIATAAEPLNRLTAFLDAVPEEESASRLDPSDILAQTRALEVVVSTFPDMSVRLIVFNLESETELMRADPFRTSGIERVTKI